MTSLTWQDLNFRDIVTLPDGAHAEVVGVRRCKEHPSGDAQLRLATDTSENDPPWHPVASLTRGPAVQDADAADWLVFSHEHSAWWKPRRWGCTDLTSQAGRYPEAEAREICEGAAYRWHRGAGGPKALPPEVMIRADAEDHFAAICAATEVAVNSRGETAEREPVETVRVEVVLRKVGQR